MRAQIGLAFVVTLIVMVVPNVAPAGCPLILSDDNTCDGKVSTISGCVNAIAGNLSASGYAERSLPGRDAAARPALMPWIKAGLPAMIERLGSTTEYEAAWLGRAPCDSSWQGIDRCEIELRTAQHGLDVLTKPELIALLSPATRARLQGILQEHKATLIAQLDAIVASGQGDPSQLCNKTYATVAACSRAVAADAKALRIKVFALVECGRTYPEWIVTPETGAKKNRIAPADEDRVIANNRFTYSDAVRFYRDRLEQEKALLEGARRRAQ